MHNQKSHIGVYRTGLISPEHRQHITVGREHMVEDALESIRGSAKRQSKHHFLFIGPRGIGKTHLLSLIEDGINKDEALKESCVVARFPEESNRTLSFADFLLGLCEILADALPNEGVWQEKYSKLETEENDDIIVDTVVPCLKDVNRKENRTIVIMLENLSELFTRQIKNKNDIASLRKFLMDKNGCLLIGTAPLCFNSITDVGQPFFDFFDVQHIEHLTENETIDLIRRNLEWEKRTDILEEFDSYKPRLLALYRMTGGSPRLTVMLYELIAHDRITEVQDQFNVLLDRITPFYQDRLNELPPQERALLETMAKMRDQDKTPNAIAALMRMKQAQTSTLLKRLSKSHYISSSTVPGDKRSRRYSIREGFFDLWLYMNISRGAKKRLPFLLDFFNSYYACIEEREKRRDELREKLKSDPSSKDAVLEMEYLSELGDSEEKEQAKLELAKHYVCEGQHEYAVETIRESAKFKPASIGGWIAGHMDGKQADYLSELGVMIDCWEQHRSGDLEAFAERLSKLSDGLTYINYNKVKIDFLRDHLELVEDEKTQIGIRLDIARVLRELAQWKEAEVQLRKALEQSVALKSLGWESVLTNNLAELFRVTGRLDEAEPLYRRALEIMLQLRMTTGFEHPKFSVTVSNYVGLMLDLGKDREKIIEVISGLAAKYGLELKDLSLDEIFAEVQSP